MLPYNARGVVLLRKIPAFRVSSIRLYSSGEASFEIEPCKLYLLEEGPSTSVSVDKEEALKLYTQMSIIRRMENASATLYKAKLIRGFCHLYAGQEAVCVGVYSQLKKDIDTVITAYRAHGWTWIMGETVFSVIAELLGRKGGCSKGKGGSMHTYAPSFYGGNGIVGAHVPLGTGCALAQKYTGKGGINVCLYGDGAANQGQVFEAYNIAKLWKLPVLYVCENNQYGLGTAMNRASADTNFYKRISYIPGLWVDGMDVLAVRECFRFAMQYVRDNGPLIVEALTYRYFGHSMSDPGTSYRSREEIQETRQKRDPINRLKDRIISSELATEGEIQAIDKKLKQEIDEAVQKAQADPEIGVDHLQYDIYAKYQHPLRGVATGLPAVTHKTTGKPINID